MRAAAATAAAAAAAACGSNRTRLLVLLFKKHMSQRGQSRETQPENPRTLLTAQRQIRRIDHPKHLALHHTLSERDNLSRQEARSDRPVRITRIPHRLIRVDRFKTGRRFGDVIVWVCRGSK